MSRSVTHRYRDPLEEIWLRAAARLHLTVVRSDEVFASYDGAGTLAIASAAHLDADDSLAQMIFHELCHALVAGPGAFERVDWGLESNETDTVSEHATHRLQATLAGRYGLRDFFAVTTDHRPYWDALPLDPLAPGDDPAIELGRDALRHAEHPPWSGVLHEALDATRRIAEIVRAHTQPGSLFEHTLPLHRSGFVVHPDSDRTCGGCTWIYASGAVWRCRQSKGLHGGRGAVVRPGEAACERWEPPLDERACAFCGACCRQGFDLVQVGVKEPFVREHPELVAEGPVGRHLPRPGGRCVALEGHGAAHSPYRCRHYSVRPRACQKFPIAGDACREARHRAGVRTRQ